MLKHHGTRVRLPPPPFPSLVGYRMMKQTPAKQGVAHAIPCWHLLQRFLQRFSVNRFCASCGSLKVGVGHINVMPHRHRLGVASPFRHNRQRKFSGQVSLTARPHRVPEARPRLKAGTTDNLCQRSPQVGVPPTAGALGASPILFRHDVLSPS